MEEKINVKKSLFYKLVKRALWACILFGLILGAAGVCTVVFAIMNWCKAIEPETVTLALRLVVGIVLIIGGLVLAIVGLVDTHDRFEFAPIAGAAASIGVGIFFCTKYAAGVLDVFVGVCLPAILLAVSAFAIIKAIVALCNKLNTKLSIWILVLGIIGVTIGALFIAFPNELINLVWIVIGVEIFFDCVALIIYSFKVKNATRKAANELNKELNNSEK